MWSKGLKISFVFDSYLYANIFYKCLGNNSIKFPLLQTRGLAVKIAIAVEGTDSINLIEDFPLFIRHAKLFRCLDRPSQLARPHLQIWQLVFINETTQSVGELGCERKGEASIYPSLKGISCFIRQIFTSESEENRKWRGLNPIKVTTQECMILQFKNILSQ